MKLSLLERSKKLLELAVKGEYIPPNRVNGIPKHNFSDIPDEITVYAINYLYSDEISNHERKD